MLIDRDVISNAVNTLKWHVFFNVCLCALMLISALRWLAEIWQISKWGATGKLEVEFKFQRCGRKLSFSHPSSRAPREPAFRLKKSLQKLTLCGFLFISKMKSTEGPQSWSWTIPLHLTFQPTSWSLGVCPWVAWVASVSIWFQRKERQRKLIFGFAARIWKKSQNMKEMDLGKEGNTCRQTPGF